MRVTTGADLAVMNSTGIRADLARGQLTGEDLFEVLPFEDTLTVHEVSGADLRRGDQAAAASSCAVGTGKASWRSTARPSSSPVTASKPPPTSSWQVVRSDDSWQPRRDPVVSR